MAQKAAKTSTEVAEKVTFETEELAGILTFGDALALAGQKYGEDNVAVASEEIGDGFKLLENKDLLIGVGMILLTWNFSMGDHGEFVSIRLVTQDNAKYIVNDGSTGIRDQLIAYSNKKAGKQGGLFCAKGLRRSDYTFKNEQGTDTPATTYYLDTSA